MAVIEQYPYIDNDGNANEKLVKHYSDEGKQIIQLETNREYEEAVDIHPCPYTYVEKDETNEEGSSTETGNEIDDNNDYS